MSLSIKDINTEILGNSSSMSRQPNSDDTLFENVTSQQGLQPLSPYLNFDPAYLPPSQPEYIFPEGATKQRGRFELAFSQIGAACIAGAGIGGATGFYRGIKATSLAGQTGKLRRTQLINHVMKSGSSLANTFGIVSVMYSGFGVLLSWARGTDDSLNTLAAATATGMLFKSTTGLRKCALGGCIGLGVASLYCIWSNREFLTEFRNRSTNPASKRDLNGYQTTRHSQRILLVLYIGDLLGRYYRINNLSKYA